MRIGIASDHEGYELKTQILNFLLQSDFVTIDYGASFLDPDDDYPDFVIPLSHAILQNKIDRGIAICGSGIGACIAANKVKNVRAGLVQDVFSARQGVEDDNMNVICFGAKLISLPLAIELTQVFLTTRFHAEPRFARRLAKISKTEEMEMI